MNEYKGRMSTNDQESEALKKKIQKLLQENSGLAEEVRNAIKRSLLSNAQQSKAFQELTEYKKRIEQNDAENRRVQKKTAEHPGEPILRRGSENCRENLRLSADQISKLNSELNDYKNRVSVNNQESETYKSKIQKLMAENSSMGDEVRTAQENLRLSR